MGRFGKKNDRRPSQWGIPFHLLPCGDGLVRRKRTLVQKGRGRNSTLGKANNGRVAKGNNPANHPDGGKTLCAKTRCVRSTLYGVALYYTPDRSGLLGKKRGGRFQRCKLRVVSRLEPSLHILCARLLAGQRVRGLGSDPVEFFRKHADREEEDMYLLADGLVMVGKDKGPGKLLLTEHSLRSGKSISTAVDAARRTEIQCNYRAGNETRRTLRR